MNALARVGLAAAILILAGGPARADDKKDIDKAKLIGAWKVTKAEGVPVGTLVEFTKDGKIIIKVEMKGEKKTYEGTYKVDGDKLLTEMKIEGEDMKDSDTIKTLTDEKLSLIGKDGKEAELEKVKKK